jgi:lipoprotein-releasing system permease protein
MIFTSFERMVALRYLRARRQEGSLSVMAIFAMIGIALGVATLIVVMAVMNGFRADLLSRILGINGHLTVFADQGPIRDFDEFTERLRAVAGVSSVVPQVQGQVMVTSGGRALGGLVRGVRRETLEQRALIAQNIVAGSLSGFEGDDVVLLGSRLARRLGLSVGDDVTLVTPRGNQTIMGTMPRLKAYRIVGLFEIGMYEYDSSFIYMPLEAAQLYFRLPESVNAIELFVEDPERIRTTRGDVSRVLGSGFRTVDWQQANSSFFNAVKVERNVMALILTLIILVATFNIISGQIVLVRDKSHDIAILRTMGATRGMIMRIFLMTGTFIGVVGTFFGCLVGVLFAQNIEIIRKFLQYVSGAELFPAEVYFLSHLPSKIDPVEVLVVAAVAFSLSFLMTLYPSWRAARLDPVEALRYE